MISDPLAPFLTGWEQLEGTETLVRIRRGMWVAGTTPRPPVGLTPNEVIHTHDKLVVRYYAPTTPRQQTPVVIVPSLINKAWICDLEPGRSLVEALAAKGHPTYLVDWGVPAAEDATEDVGYVLHDLLHRSIDRACRHAGAPKAHVLGYCMGGTLAGMLAALRADRIASLVVLNAPFRFSEGGRFRDLLVHLDLEECIDHDGLVAVDVMKPAFKLLDPMGNFTKYLALEAASKDPVKLRRALVRERWLEENVPMAGAFARQFIAGTYHTDDLIEGRFAVGDQTIDLASIEVPVLIVACERDFITPAPAATALAGELPHARVEVVDAGHIGIVVGGAGPRIFYPLLDEWFRA